MSSEVEVKEFIEKELAPSYLCVRDFSDGCGAKFDIVVVSDKFIGKKLLERHRMVNAALGDLIPKIHALTLKTYTREQYEELGGEYKPSSSDTGSCIKS